MAAAIGAAGSSPLARGLQNLTLPQVVSLGIIPARAGFTKACETTANAASDHPRSRGVYRRARKPAGTPRGSSPLARGLPQSGQGQVPGDRIIPARAGFTVAGLALTDYPRIIPARAGFTPP